MAAARRRATNASGRRRSTIPERLAHFVEFVNAPDVALRAGVGHRARPAGAGMTTARRRDVSAGVARLETCRSTAASPRWSAAIRSPLFRLADGEIAPSTTSNRSPVCRCWPAASSARSATCRRDVAAPQTAVRPAHRRVPRRRGRTPVGAWTVDVDRRGSSTHRPIVDQPDVVDDDRNDPRSKQRRNEHPETGRVNRTARGIHDRRHRRSSCRRADEAARRSGRRMPARSGDQDAPVGSEDELRSPRALLDNPPDLVVFTTGLGVRGWLEAADAIQLGDELRDDPRAGRAARPGAEGDRRTGHRRIRRGMDRAAGALRRHHRPARRHGT